MRVTETYRPIKFREVVLCNCRMCGKKLRRTVSDWYTMSPFNKSTHEECRKRCFDAIAKEKAELLANGATCLQCERQAGRVVA